MGLSLKQGKTGRLQGSLAFDNQIQIKRCNRGLSRQAKCGTCDCSLPPEQPCSVLILASSPSSLLHSSRRCPWGGY